MQPGCRNGDDSDALWYRRNRRIEVSCGLLTGGASSHQCTCVGIHNNAHRDAALRGGAWRCQPSGAHQRSMWRIGIRRRAGRGIGSGRRNLALAGTHRCRGRGSCERSILEKLLLALTLPSVLSQRLMHWLRAVSISKQAASCLSSAERHLCCLSHLSHVSCPLWKASGSGGQEAGTVVQ